MSILSKLKEIGEFALITFLLLPFGVATMVVGGFFDDKRPYIQAVREDVSELWNSYKIGLETTLENLRK